MNAPLRELRRPLVYIAAAVVGIAAAIVGLPWYADVAIAVVSLLVGAGVAAAWSLLRVGLTHRRPHLPQPRHAAPSQGGAERGNATFRLEGEYWTIARDGTTVRLQDAKGLRYIHRLLATPGVEVHVLDLTAEGRSARARTQNTPDDGLRSDRPLREPILDQRARAEFQRRIQDLRDEIEEANANADQERVARAREEIEAIAEQLHRSIGPGGSSGLIPDEIERARVNVTRAIRSAIAKIGEQDRSLGHHLDREIRTGTYCSYIPDPATAPIWRL